MRHSCIIALPGDQRFGEQTVRILTRTHAHTGFVVAAQKQVSEEDRERLFEALTTHPDVDYAVSVQGHKLIDEINILQVRPPPVVWLGAL
jgi:hypothetical protein